MNQFIMTIAVLAVASILHAAVGVFAAFAADEPAPPHSCTFAITR
ncbi:hypothetical protein C035_00743 [Brucella melitensis R3/07-2]|nr:hypothetical protein C061_01138 [Brucella melitensis F5/07-239A]ENQ97243.1 hypothetical protein C035_00743 [Brucella melitensis R3/07-2]ENS89266.1 hypothetical protein B984_00318 [Brucella melitensis UK31/99]ENT74788.1 hypothetical protein D628_00304 [Brucella melitensis F15/06-7]SPU57616.1 transglycosylase [Brucella melitensis]